MGAIVCKFGGTSLADAEQIRKVESIIRSDPRRRYIVPSAPGKRNKEDTKVTDLLYLCYELAKQGLDISQPFSVIRDRYLGIFEALRVDLDMTALIDELHKQIVDGAQQDFVASRGEHLCGRIMASLLGATFVDPAEGIFFSKEGGVDGKSYDKMGKLLQGESTFVIPGFYGTGPDGNVNTFSRGGSDITGAIVARAVEADVYENWTDVHGLMMADPHIVPEAKPMQEVTYRELRELAYMGATVLHDESMFPVRELKIPINIRNTNEPDYPGTMIVSTRDPSQSTIIGIAGRPNFSMIYIEKALMNNERGFGRKVLDILESHNISYEHSPTGIDSMSVIVRDEELEDEGERVCQDIRRILQPDRVDLIGELALIATVGQGMAFQVGIAARLFSALADANVNVRVIDQGSSEINIIVGVDKKDYEKSVRAIYQAFADS